MMKTLQRKARVRALGVVRVGEVDATGRDVDDYTQLLQLATWRSLESRPELDTSDDRAAWAGGVMSRQISRFYRDRARAIPSVPFLDHPQDAVPADDYLATNETLCRLQALLGERDWEILVAVAFSNSLIEGWQYLGFPCSYVGFSKKFNKIRNRARRFLVRAA